MLPYEAYAGQEIAHDELISMIQSMESNINVLEYKMQYTRTTVENKKVDFSKSVSVFSNLTEPALIWKDTLCLFEPTMGRIYFKQEGTTRRIKEDLTFIGDNRLEIGFDGHIRSQLNGLANKQQTAIVSKEPIKFNQELSTFEAGMDTVLACYNGIGLSKYLMSDSVISMSIQGVIQDNGILEVSFRKSDQQKIRLNIDINKGGAILSEEYFSTSDDNKVVVKMEYTWDKNENGYWVPVKGVGVAGAHNPKVYLWSYESFRVNHVKPSPSNYTVEFPSGVEVIDRIADIQYRVGAYSNDIDKLIHDSLLEAIEKNSDLSINSNMHPIVSVIKETGAEQGDEFSTSPLIGNSDQAASKRKGMPRGYIWIIGFLLVLGVVLIHYRCKKKCSMKLFLAFAVIIIMYGRQGAMATTIDSHASAEHFNGWVAKGAGGAMIPVYQCGYNSTAYVLQFYNKKYDTKQLMNLLRPTVKGISLSNIVRTLHMHGLDAEARRKVNVANLSSILTKERIIRVFGIICG